MWHVLGVPRGFVVGPLVFYLYAFSQYGSASIKGFCLSHCYADLHQGNMSQSCLSDWIIHQNPIWLCQTTLTMPRPVPYPECNIWMCLVIILGVYNVPYFSIWGQCWPPQSRHLQLELEGKQRRKNVLGKNKDTRKLTKQSRKRRDRVWQDGEKRGWVDSGKLTV